MTERKWPDGHIAHTLDLCIDHSPNSKCKTCGKPARWHWNDSRFPGKEYARLGCDACFESAFITAALANLQEGAKQ